jgi:hypothetical protein
MSPAILAALISQIGVPELIRWLSSLRAENRMVTEAEALSKLKLDVDQGNTLGESFLETHPKTP